MQAATAADQDNGLIGRQIVAAREQAGISQGELGRRLGRDRRQLSRWEHGRVIPSIASLREIADALELPLDYFA